MTRRLCGAIPYCGSWDAARLQVPADLAGLLREQRDAHRAARAAQERAVYTPDDATMDAAMPDVHAAEERAAKADSAVVEWTRANLKETP